MKNIDFSIKHDVLIENDDGSLQPMDEPYFKETEVAEGTWCILSDGDYSYLVEGSQEALVIDSGYGCGNIRKFCQSLTSKPVRYIANTHHHFDHTANNAYFEKAFMSRQTYPLATIPFKSFEGISFPRDYPVEIIGEGYCFQLGNRLLETLFIPNHAPGSLAFLDHRERILFCGDEIMNHQVRAEVSVEEVLRNFTHLAERRSEFDWLCSGSAYCMPASQIESYISMMERVLSGDMGEPNPDFLSSREVKRSHDGCIIYKRMLPRPTDRKIRDPKEAVYARFVTDGDLKFYFDSRKIKAK